jgi:hypothetical protein
MIPEEKFHWEQAGLGEDGMTKHLPISVDELGRGPTDPDPAHHYVCWCGDPECPLALALQHAWAAGRRKGHDDATTTLDWMTQEQDWRGQTPSLGFRATFDQELTERPGFGRRQLRFQADPSKPPCLVPDCPGDGRYAPPGRGHRCTWDQYMEAAGGPVDVTLDEEGVDGPQ